MKWQPTAVFLPGKSYGQRRVLNYGPWGHSVWHYWAEHTQMHWVYVLHRWQIFLPVCSLFSLYLCWVDSSLFEFLILIRPTLSIFSVLYVYELYLIEAAQQQWHISSFFFYFWNLVQSLSHVWLFVTPWTAAHQASLSVTISCSLFKLMSLELMIPSNHLILCHSLLLLPSIFPSIRVFSQELGLHIRWPKYWSFSISPSNDYSGLISFRMSWLDLLAVLGTLKSLLQHHNLKASVLQHSAFFNYPWAQSNIAPGQALSRDSRENLVLTSLSAVPGCQHSLACSHIFKSLCSLSSCCLLLQCQIPLYLLPIRTLVALRAH